MKTEAPIIVWFRNDLRVEDQEALYKASLKTQHIIPIYCIDERQFEMTDLGLPKTGYWRTKFLWETLTELGAAFAHLGSKLVIRVGYPEKVIPAIATKVKAQAVYASKEVTDEELKVEKRLEKSLWKHGVNLELFWQSTLYHVHDLPYPIHSLPNVFTQFRKSVERKVSISAAFPKPAQLQPHTVTSEDIPEISSLIPTGFERKLEQELHFKGGSNEALNRVQHYFWEEDCLKNYKHTRNGLLGIDYSSKLSPWLANGSISPRQVYWGIKKYESERVKNQSTYWLYFELMWRDYFRFVAKKFNNAIFKSGGIKEKILPTQPNYDKFQKWIDGKTGIPFIDANMLEVKETGFMSNRGRQNVASFLVKDLSVDWVLGAAYFEHVLVDYDPCSNWCNWNYVAGVGNDPREHRYFNILSQAKRYDPKGEYVKHWLPQLANVPPQHVHTVGNWLMEKNQNQVTDEDLAHYLNPIVPFEHWEKH